MLPFVNTAIVTRTSVTLPADTYFPDLDTNEDWELTETSDVMEHEGIRFKFCTYKRKR